MAAAARLQDKLALVSGAGISDGVARAMATGGARVIVTDLKASAAERVAAAIANDTIHYVPDVTDRAVRDALAAQVRRAVSAISVLVTHA